MPVAGRIAGQRHLQALRDGIVLSTPLLIIGSIFLILANLPFEGYLAFMSHVFGKDWTTALSYPVSATFGIMALIASFGIAYRLAEKYGVDPLSSGAISVAAFILATPTFTEFLPAGAKAAVHVTGVLPMMYMGSKGLFVAMILALISTEIYRKIIQMNIVFKMPDGVPPAVSKSFVALIPGAAVILVVWLLRLGVEHTSFHDLHSVVTKLLAGPLGAFGGSLFGTIIIVLLLNLLWTTGLHGGAIVGAVMGPIWLSSLDDNRLAIAAGHDPHNIFTQPFFDLFVYMGGSGVTVVFAFMMAFFSKSQQAKQLGRLALGPGLFNINEPIVFGAPVVMNPILMVPFILTPVITTIVTYLAMKTGMVPLTNGVLPPWTSPPIMGGYLATLSWKGAAMQLVNLAIAFSIYFPFFKIWDKQNLMLESGSENEAKKVS